MTERVGRRETDPSRLADEIGAPRGFADVLESCEGNLPEPIFEQLVRQLRAMRAQIDESKLFGEKGTSDPPRSRSGRAVTHDLEECLSVRASGLSDQVAEMASERELKRTELGPLMEACTWPARSGSEKALRDLVSTRQEAIEAALSNASPPNDGRRSTMAQRLLLERIIGMVGGLLAVAPALSREDVLSVVRAWPSTRGPGATGFSPILVRRAVESLRREFPKLSKREASSHVAMALGIARSTVEETEVENRKPMPR